MCVCCPHDQICPARRANDAPCACQPLLYEETCTAPVSRGSGLYGAMVQAYNTHQDVLLSPDDLWLSVCLRFAQYVNGNADKMRGLFVDHEGQKKLSVTTWHEGSETQWDEFAGLMQAEIAKHTKSGIADVLQAQFTTTGRLEALLSVATVMDTFKAYFKYGRMIPLCGIRAVRFMGTQGDWEALIDKAQRLQPYAVDRVWSDYIKRLVPVLRKLLDTYKGQPDVGWWNKVMNITRGSLGSGSTDYVSGWILALYGLDPDQPVPVYDLAEYTIQVPVEVDNHLTKVKKTVHLVGGFGGVHETEPDADGIVAFRPQVGLMVHWDGVATKL